MKHPLNIKGLASRSDPDQIKRWWPDYPYAKIAIATGESSGIVALGIDLQHSDLEPMKELQAKLGTLPKTITNETGGGGLHLFYKYPRGVGLRSRHLGPGVELKSDGDYVIAPRSRHKSGKPYEWAPDRSPDDL